jgi:hypothetical protein
VAKAGATAAGVEGGGRRAGTGALLRAIRWMLLMRRATTTLRKVTAHGGHAGNDTADALAALGADGKGDHGGQVCVWPRGVGWSSIQFSSCGRLG